MHVPASRGGWHANVFLAILSFNPTIHDLADQPFLFTLPLWRVRQILFFFNLRNNILQRSTSFNSVLIKANDSLLIDINTALLTPKVSKR